ncbi:MAG: hypothetical protein IPL59_06570 [Candidatus Competibacteraceae bacterium]|nr:hypothetical protein [Candidatus Competibacteraceae bacterium]
MNGGAVAGMRTSVPEKIIKIINEIDAKGNAKLTRLTVLKKWLEPPGRLPAFGLWMAACAASRKREATETAGKLFDEAHALLAAYEIGAPGPSRFAAEDLYKRLQRFQNEYQNRNWATVRIIRHWDLLLVEEGLALYLRHHASPSHGYKLAADYCQHHDLHYGNSLSGPSRLKLEEMVRFMFALEAVENGVA